MPDISRSDSNRSDASRPRVSFNRDVHVKRISGPRTANAYSLSPDGTSFVPTSVRRERPMTKREMTKEAEVVLKQVDKVSCTATSTLKGEKPKKKKKRKDSFSFLKKLDKTKTSSSDYDSGSSQEYRIYHVNGPTNSNINNSNKNNDRARTKKNEKKIYDFMSLDRKKLKKEKKNKALDYLSLERNNEVLEKMKKEKPKTLLSAVFDKIDGKAKKTTFATPLPPAAPDPKPREEPRPKPPKITLDAPDDPAKKKQLSPIIESPGADYFDKKPPSAVDKLVKKLSEKSLPKLSVNTGPVGVREPQGDTCHNDNRPFSYTSGDRGEWKSDGAGAEGLGSGKEDLKATSPTNDVIYAQVIVGGRDGNAQKATVNERVASNEVGRVFVGDELNQSQVGLNYKSDSNPNGDVCEIVAVDGDEMWQARSDYVGMKERLQSGRLPQTELYGENPGRRDLFRRSSNDSGGTSPSPTRDFTRVIKVAPKYEPARRAPADLRDLSMRREILLSRSESHAKERFNSLKRLQEPARVQRQVSSANGIRPQDRLLRNDFRSLEDDVNVNQKFVGSLRRVPKDVELTEPVVRKKRESKPGAPLKNDKEKDDKPRLGDRDHVIVTDDDDDNLIRKLARLGKSKSFVQDKPKNKKMDKVKMLFMKKREGKSSESDDDLANRYIEYRGSDVEMSDRSTDSSPRRTLYRTETVPLEGSHGGRKRLSTPTTTPTPTPTPTPYDAMGTLTRIKNDKNRESHWPKPLEKMAKRGKPKNKADDAASETTSSPKQASLRFFGDTDQESTADPPHGHGLLRKASDSDDDPHPPSRPDSRMTDSTLKGPAAARPKSKYDLDRPDYGLKQMNHGLQMSSKGDAPSDCSTANNDSYDINGLKYGPSVTRSSSSVTNVTKYGQKEKLRGLKSTPTTSNTTPEEPLSRRVKSHGNLYSQEDGRRGGRRRLYESSADSATEGDSSQHSSKSMIYLHAATVGDIPGPRNVYKSERRSQSREELSSIGDNSTILAPGKKTLSRSISVLAPWRPKHNKDDRTLHYDSAVDYGRGKPPTGMAKSKRSSSRERKHNEFRFNTIGKESRKRKDLLR